MDKCGTELNVMGVGKFRPLDGIGFRHGFVTEDELTVKI
jgi:hypothetical protein